MLNARLQSATKGEILIVEDTPESLRLLTELLESAGYAVRQAQDGRMALATIRTRLPDLILLDIAMPDIDGFDVCRKLKADPHTRDVPIIFCSALHDTEFKVQGFARGAVDFITNPYQPEEVLVRIRTHIELYHLRTELEQRVAARTAELQTTANSLRDEIQARQKVEEDLRLSAKAFEASFTGIMVTDAQCKIIAVNPAFCRITGYSKQDVIGMTPQILQSGKHDAQFFGEMWRALETRGIWNGEIWNRRKDGNVVPMMETITTFRSNDGNISHYLATLGDLSEIRDAQTLINFLAYRDNLTGLSNRVVARKHYDHVVLEASSRKTRIAFICLDLDRFKVINDSIGHAIGDQLLKLVAAKLTACLGDKYHISRDGGDEFLIIANDVTAVDDLVKLAQRLNKEIAQEFSIDHHQLSVTTSIGVALFPDDGQSFDDLLRAAENALYQCKKKGGNDYCLFKKQMNAEARLRMEVENCLRGAIANGELQLVYQPKLSLKHGRIVGAEALVRWNSPVLGFVSPANFIPLAEETGLILAIDEWVITTACQQIRAWKAAGLGENKVSINLSTLQFRRGDLIALTQRVLLASGISAACLDFEITEGVLMENIHNALPILDSVKNIGVSVSLDDFGTGYSSLSYLKKLPIDTLKIDKSFVDEIHIKPRDAMIALAIISLGHNLGLTVIAEGVEHKQQHDYLLEHGCDEIQGYYFSKPLAVKDFEQLLAAQLAKTPLQAAQ
jgi:diguanylate cyclase (GGDEF)-like protein/PAS domain S-box-containing protein